MFSVTVLGLFRCLLLVSLILVSLSVKASQELRFGITPDYAPYESKDATQELVGFDIQIAKAICARLNKTCVFVETPWEGLIQGLTNGKYDAIISAFTSSPERVKQVDFTDRYMAEDGKDIAIAIPKGASALKKSLNASIKAIKTSGEWQSAFDKYFPGKANPLASELSKLSIKAADKKPSGSEGGQASPDINNSTDGFDFRTYLNANKTPLWEAFGGPCRPVGVQGMSGRIDDALAASRPDYRSRYNIQAYSYLTGTNLKVLWTISNNVDWQSTMSEYQRLYNDARQHGQSGIEVDRAKDNLQMAECLSMNNIQYVIALENWSKKNKKELQKMWDAFIGH
jgi:hypothetical protein